MKPRHSPRPVSPRRLRDLGVLGINRRNADYILPGNPRRFYPRVDDKLITKSICLEHGIPVPETYATVERYGDLRRLPELVSGHQEFVVKPARGAAGRGILVIQSHSADEFQTSDGVTLNLADVKYYMSAILAGLYSLGGHLDRAIIERRIVCHPSFASVAVGGTADIRIICYKCIPVMAMIRLPTAASRGRANLHQGAVAAGVDIRSGTTTGGVCGNRILRVHPDTDQPIHGLGIPHWRNAVRIAIRVSRALGLDYVGIDLIIDGETGPTVVEANARPGLAIQIANREGLLQRLRQVDERGVDGLSTEDAWQFATALARTDLPAVPES